MPNGDIASQLIRGAQETAQAAPDVAGGFASGVQIAQSIERAQQARANLEQQKQQLRFSKIGKVIDVIKSADKFKDKAAQSALLRNFLPKMIQSMGVDDVFTEDMTAMLQASPEVRAKMLTLQQQVRDGEISPAQAFAQFTPDQIGQVDESAFLKEETARREAAEARERAQITAGFRAEAAETRRKQFEVRQIQTIKQRFDQRIRKDRERITAADTALTLLRSGKPISEEVVKTQMARLSGEVGNLTEADITRFGGSRALVDRAKQLTSTLLTGRLTESNRKQLTSIAQDFRNVLNRKINDEAQRDAQSGSRLLNIQPQRILDVLNVEAITGRPEPAGRAQPTTLTNPATGAAISPQGIARIRSKLEGLSAADRKTQIDRLAKSSKMSAQRVRKLLGVD